MGTIPLLKVIHIDDDPRCLQDVRAELESIPNIRYLDGFVSATDALGFMERERVDLVFLDVEMPGPDGLWLAQQIKARPIDIIFVTAHAGYALRAFEVCALNYILKPVDRERLAAMLERSYSCKKGARGGQVEQLGSFYRYLDAGQRPDRIFINMVGTAIMVKLDGVLYFAANKNYTAVVMRDGGQKVSSKPIRIYEGALANNPDFVRVHRSYIINKNYLKTIQRNAATRQIFLTMENGDAIETSYKTKEEAMERLA